MNELVLTPAALLDILQQVDELKEYPISLDQTSSTLRLKIGDSSYDISTRNAEPVTVSEDAVEIVREVNDDTYDELDNTETVESGLIKELIKTLAVGGLVRLTTKLLGGGNK